MKLFKIPIYNINKAPLGETYVVAKNITEAKRILKEHKPYVKSFGKYSEIDCIFTQQN